MVSCQDCGNTYEINKGILDFFDKTRYQNTQSLFELHTRDSIAKKFCEESYQSDKTLDAMEIFKDYDLFLRLTKKSCGFC